MNVLDYSFDNLLTDLGYAQSLDGTDGQLSNQFARQAARALTVATAYAWRAFPWRETISILPALDLVSGGEPNVPLLAPGYEVLRVYAENPLAAWTAEEEPEVVDYLELPRGNISLAGATAPATPFYAVRQVPPKFAAASAWSSATTYLAGQFAYQASTGDCWLARVGSTNTALPTWVNWQPGLVLEAATSYVRHHGVIWDVSEDHEAAAANEPGVGASWQDKYLVGLHQWTPQRLPDVLREAVLAGAEAWLARAAEGQILTAAALAKVMDDHLGAAALRRWRSTSQSRKGRALLVA